MTKLNNVQYHTLTEQLLFTAGQHRYNVNNIRLSYNPNICWNEFWNVNYTLLTVELLL